MEDKSCKTPRWRLLKAQLNNLSPKVFHDQITNMADSIIIDVRTPKEFESGHIKNAVNIDFLSEDFWDRIEQIPSDKNIFVYCRTGRRSIRTCTLMRNGGFDKDKIFNLEGGYALWLETIK